MLFAFSNYSNVCFWMENTEIPLKQIWIAANGSVVNESDAVPYSTALICHNGKAVLETSPASSIRMGDKIRVQ